MGVGDRRGRRAGRRAREAAGERSREIYLDDEATIARLDAFRQEHVARLDPRGRAAGADDEALAGAKAVAWMAYGIHGDELSSVDAAAAVAYRLIAGSDAGSRALREGLVILIDPMENPDGRDRYLAQISSFAHTTPNPSLDDMSHQSVWPWGRGNHYLFDLNRDFFSMVHPESRRSTVIASWDPQLAVDSHEMGADSTYLFTPPRHPFNPHLPPEELENWNRFAADQAQALDARGYSYFTREWNEEFFPGYGSSWPAYRGAVGILYEMSRTSGQVVRKRSGEYRTYPEAVEHHTTSSIANLTTLSSNRAMLLDKFIDQRRAAIDSAGGDDVAAWLLPRKRRPGRTDALVQLLRDQGIEVQRWSGSNPAVGGLRDARTGKSADSTALGDDVWAVPVAQPAARQVRVLLDPHVPMDAGFLREEREYIEKGRGSRLYETTAWSLILAFDVEAYWTTERPKGGSWSDAPIDEADGVVDAPAGTLAWILDGSADPAMPALGDLFAGDLSVRVLDRPLTVDGQSFQRGDIVIPVEGNPEDTAARLEAVARERGVAFRATRTGLAESGPDLGGSHFLPLIEPRVGVWTGYPVSPTGYGAIWHMLDEKLQYRFSGLPLDRFRQTDLRRYNVLVFPPASGGASVYQAMLGDAGIEALKSWVRSGGTAIGVGSGAQFLADKEIDLTQARLRSQALELYPPMVLGPSADQIESAGPFRAVGLLPVQDGSSNGESKDTKSKGAKGKSDKPAVSSPYDVAPLLGDGARPFAEGVAQGTPVEGDPVELETWLRPLLPPGQLKATPADLSRADRRLRGFGPQGAFVRVDLDPEAWLTWGMDAEVAALLRAGDTLVATPPVQVAARFAELDRLHLGGLLWPEAGARIARTAYATRESVGRGQIVLFLDEPGFRGWTRGTERLLQNALLFGPGLGTRWSAPW